MKYKIKTSSNVLYQFFIKIGKWFDPSSVLPGVSCLVCRVFCLEWQPPLLMISIFSFYNWMFIRWKESNDNLPILFSLDAWISRQSSPSTWYYGYHFVYSECKYRYYRRTPWWIYPWSFSRWLLIPLVLPFFCRLFKRLAFNIFHLFSFDKCFSRYGKTLIKCKKLQNSRIYF